MLTEKGEGKGHMYIALLSFISLRSALGLLCKVHIIEHTFSHIYKVCHFEP
jgi:hypothetical protein